MKYSMYITIRWDGYTHVLSLTENDVTYDSQAEARVAFNQWLYGAPSPGMPPATFTKTVWVAYEQKKYGLEIICIPRHIIESSIIRAVINEIEETRQ